MYKKICLEFCSTPTYFSFFLFQPLERHVLVARYKKIVDVSEKGSIIVMLYEAPCFNFGT